MSWIHFKGQGYYLDNKEYEIEINGGLKIKIK